MENSREKAQPISHVIWDLDGTILDSEGMFLEAMVEIASKYGKTLTPDIEGMITGVRPLDAWANIAKRLEIDETPEALYAQSEGLLSERWKNSRLMPGALRILEHFKSCGIPQALATSTYRCNVPKKMIGRESLMSMFQATVCGDEVPNGKPSPDIFLSTAEKLGADPKNCLVFEDAPAGAKAGVAAGMRVAVIPSLTDIEAYPPVEPGCSVGILTRLASLLDFKPSEFGMPPLTDFVCGSVPVTPTLCMKGTVVKGFGRGSKELGIPTANLDSKSIAAALAKTVTGIYLGWASVGSSTEVHKMVMSIGWNPFYKNEKKTAEPWLLHTFEEDFYGEELRLAVCGYIRPESNFNSLEDLIARIHKDGDIASEALDQESMNSLKDLPFLKP
ncbi:hypothetical protein BSKO_10402 [Bryopsis sp. KO-2023]|nr:hypothetical protein BSKO_10402 [Bryopsis sp. KO-2023]